MKSGHVKKTAVRCAAAVLAPVLLYGTAALLSDIWFEGTLGAPGGAESATREGAFCFNRLQPKEQQLYDVIADAIASFDAQSRSVYFVPTEEEYENALRAVLFDHPAYFYADAEACTLKTGAYTGAVRLVYTDAAKSKKAQLDDAVEELLAAREETASVREAADVLQNALLARCATGTDAGHTAYDALVTGNADGFGYALAYQLLCDAAGIACETVTGTVDGVPHSWNALCIDGVWGYTDVMWNDVSDSVQDEGLHFHGYDFISLDEMMLDGRTFDAPEAWASMPTEDYYEANGLFAENKEALPALLLRLLTEARRNGETVIAFSVGADEENPAPLSDFVLKEYLNAAITEANTVGFDGDVPRLRTVNRIYHASGTRNALTVRLFYEEGDT